MKNRWKPVLIITLIIGMALSAKPGFAGIGVQPTITEIEVAPGGVETGSFRVANAGEEAVHVKVELEDWLKLRAGKSPVDVEEWLFIDETEFELEPGEVKNIGYQVIAPVGIKGELIAMAFFSSAVPTGGTLGITGRFGVAVYAGIEGTEIVRADIESIKINDSMLMVDVRNKGNVHIRPSGKIIVRDRKGEVVHESKIPYYAVIFAGRKHTYPLDLGGKEIPAGKYKVEAIFDTGTIYEKNETFSKKASLRIE